MEAGLDGYVYGQFEPVGDQIRATFIRVDLPDAREASSIAVSYRVKQMPAQSSLYRAAWHLMELDPETLPVFEEETPEPEATTDGGQQPSRAGAMEAEGVYWPVAGAPAFLGSQTMPAAVAAGSAVVITGAAIYVTGGVGLSVPWNEDQAGWADPLFLGGVGVATWVVSSLVANQILVRTLPKAGVAAKVEPGSAGLTLRF